MAVLKDGGWGQLDLGSGQPGLKPLLSQGLAVCLGKVSDGL